MLTDARVVVLGGGVAGLHAAYLLTKVGFAPLLLEKQEHIGGLCSSHDCDTYHIEKYYHHIFPSDNSLLELLEELGLADDIIWRSGGTGFYIDGAFYTFNTPQDLLRFTPLSLLERIRLGIQTLLTRGEPDWGRLDGENAERWLTATYGKSIYKKMFRPLLLTKFGLSMDKASAAFVCGRLRARVRARGPGMVKEKLGYIQGGYHRLIDSWTKGIEDGGGRVIAGAEVQALERGENGFIIRVTINGIEKAVRSDAVLSTLPIPLLLQRLKDPPKEMRSRLSRIHYRAVLCLTLALSRRLMPYYWLNILDEGHLFGGVIEHTNLVSEEQYSGEHIVYVFRYLDTSDPLWTKGEASVRDEMLEDLKKLFPDLTDDDVIWTDLAKDEFATPQFIVGYRKLMPTNPTDVEGLFLAGGFQVYPFSRNLDSIIEVTNRAVKELEGHLQSHEGSAAHIRMCE